MEPVNPLSMIQEGGDEASISQAWRQELRTRQAAWRADAETPAPGAKAKAHAIGLLATDATICPKDEDGIHRDILRHFPYTVFYEVDNLTVTVLAVAHQRREPGYWRAR